MQNPFTDALLTRIRSRTGSDDAPPTTGSAEIFPVNPASLSVREAQFSDFESIHSMNLRLGQGADSIENWNRLWRDNPALKETQAKSRIGWVLEDAGKITGFLGSIPLAYRFQGQVLSAAATCRFAVEPSYRGFTHMLVNSFFRQKDIDLFLNTTATVGAGKMMSALRALPVPQAEYGRVLFWVLQPAKFTEAVLHRAGLPSGVSRMGGFAGSFAIRGDIALRSRKPGKVSQRFEIASLGLDEIGFDFSRFWQERANQAEYLFAQRSAEVLNWHFNAPESRKKTSVLAAYSAGKLVGYTIVRHEPVKNELRRSVIADLMTETDESELIMSLLSAAHASAKQAGSHVLELLGFPRKIREVSLLAKPYWRDFPACPYYYKARERSLQQRLLNESAWYACSYDGDTTLWP
jgi:hypothetical protein